MPVKGQRRRRFFPPPPRVPHDPVHRKGRGGGGTTPAQNEAATLENLAAQNQDSLARLAVGNGGAPDHTDQLTPGQAASMSGGADPVNPATDMGNQWRASAGETPWVTVPVSYVVVAGNGAAEMRGTYNAGPNHYPGGGPVAPSPMQKPHGGRGVHQVARPAQGQPGGGPVPGGTGQ